MSDIIKCRECDWIGLAGPVAKCGRCSGTYIYPHRAVGSLLAEGSGEVQANAWRLELARERAFSARLIEILDDTLKNSRANSEMLQGQLTDLIRPAQSGN